MSFPVKQFAATLALLLFAVVPAPGGGAGPSAPLPSRGPESAQDEHAGLVVVKFADEARVRLRGGTLVSLGGADLGSLATTLAAFGDPAPVRLFTRDENGIEAGLAAARRRSGRELADLNGYFELRVAARDEARLLAALSALDVVETAYPAPRPVPPPADVPPATPDFEPNQLHLGAAPGGIDAREAWTHTGGRGAGLRIIDIEYDWNDGHEDLDDALGQKECYEPRGLYIDHGTAVLGELGGEDNGYGVTGIVPDAGLGMVTQYPVGMSNSVARAIDCAASLLGPGDVILLEAQTGGPNGAYVPVEWNQAEFDAIAAATAKGIVVVEAAGNGNEDLDGPEFLGRFDRSVRDSGAIIVGAGAPPNSGQPDRSRLSFSTHGSRVDVQGYGELVTTTGYGGLFNGGGDPDQYYTSTFSGTSSASPIVTGAAAALQAIQMARTGSPLDPIEVRRILTETGSPQQAGPYIGNIGPRPDLARAIRELATLAVTGWVVDDAPPLGNADGVLDPGETATLRVTAQNAGDVTATNVVGIVASRDGEPVRVTDPHAVWPDLAPGASAESLAPHHGLTSQPDAVCGDRLTFDLRLASDPYMDAAVVTLDVGQVRAVQPSADTPVDIPKNGSGGVASVIEVAEAFTLADVQAAVDLTHGDAGQLRLVLQSPQGTSVTLHDHSSAGTADISTTYDRQTQPDGPGGMNDFDGEPSQGTWTLTVIDDVSGPVPPGTLDGWSLELTATAPFRCNPLSCTDPLPAAMGASLQVGPSGTDDLVFTWDAASDAAGYRVWRSGSPGMSGAVMVGQTAGTGLVESGGRVDPAPAVFYQVRAVNSCEWEGP